MDFHPSDRYASAAQNGTGKARVGGDVVDGRVDDGSNERGGDEHGNGAVIATFIPSTTTTTTLSFHGFTKPPPPSLCSVPSHVPRPLHPHGRHGQITSPTWCDCHYHHHPSCRRQAQPDKPALCYLWPPRPPPPCPLSHPAVGAFLTHCGWNSTLEGVCAGVPMITWPMFAGQFFNEKLVVQVLGTGVGVGAQAVVHLHEEDKFGVLVKRETVMKAVDIVMDEGMEGEERRKRARELGDMAMRTIEERGSYYLNVTLLIQDVLQQVNDKGRKEDWNGS
ncbi:UDP-glycosyltransferase 73E1-like [Actinidia eriantha]|uniref:UDP-glycosyltransferase 73E1-like n=1 Tax=Actinidia eriantha TaxID=165200 RepID=UPI00258577E3|nr:UDP-glycosyltransferase 73E1-like [Actinidia eriantha]